MPSSLAPYLPQIEANPWFAALPPALRANLLARAALRRLPAGNCAVPAWRPAMRRLYAVLAGSLSP